MIEFKDCTCTEGIERLGTLLGRLSVLRGLLTAAPVKTLLQICDDLNCGEVMKASFHYHDLCYELLSARVRRVSGSLWKDFLINALLEEPNAFSEMAAMGETDEPLYEAMRLELSLLGALSGLDGGTLKRWIAERLRDVKLKPRQARDAISLMSSAAWAGGTHRPLPKDEPQLPAVPQLPGNLGEGEWLGFDYPEPVLDGSYVSDEALEEMYRRLLCKTDWQGMADDLWNFHNAYGSGVFLKYRLFTVCEGRLEPLNDKCLPEQDQLTFYEKQRSLIVNNAISFMRGERASGMLLLGGEGTGKTTQILSLAREFPEIRLIFADGHNAGECASILPKLAGQPLKFILLLDDIDFESESFRLFKSRVMAGRAVPDNVLLSAAARAGGSSLFPLRIEFPHPPFKAFIELVQQMLMREGHAIDYDTVQNACIDYKASANEELSFNTAKRVMHALLEG